MKDHKQPRLAIGAFDAGQIVPTARRVFLRRIQEHFPETLQELHDRVLNLFLKIKGDSDLPLLPRAAAELRKKTLEGTIESQNIASLQNAFQKGHFDVDLQFKAVLVSLFDWAKRWNIDADWCLFWGLKTLNAWSKSNPIREKLQWPLMLFGLNDRQGEPQPPDGIPAWNVFEDSKQAYMQMIEAEARAAIANNPILAASEKSHLNDFVKSIRTVAANYQRKVGTFHENLGYEPVNKKELLKHIKWTVYFQVGRQTFKSIADASRVEPQAVTKAVKSVLKLIGLIQRPAPSGRPLGSKDFGSRRIVRKKAMR